MAYERDGRMADALRLNLELIRRTGKSAPEAVVTMTQIGAYYEKMDRPRRSAWWYHAALRHAAPPYQRYAVLAVAHLAGLISPRSAEKAAGRHREHLTAVLRMGGVAADGATAKELVQLCVAEMAKPPRSVP
jgi:hypothetical protein